MIWKEKKKKFHSKETVSESLSELKLRGTIKGRGGGGQPLLGVISGQSI